jgi:hypothetical protein
LFSPSPFRHQSKSCRSSRPSTALSADTFYLLTAASSQAACSRKSGRRRWPRSWSSRRRRGWSSSAPSTPATAGPAGTGSGGTLHPPMHPSPSSDHAALGKVR